MNKLHVLHIIGKLNAFGGTPAKLFYQVTTPSDHVRYTICCVEKDGHMADKFRDSGVEVITLNHASGANPKQLFDLISLIRDRSVDVVNTHFARSNTYGRLAAILTGVPMLTSEHGIFRHTSPVLNCADNMLNLFTRFNVSNSHATMQSVKKDVRLNNKNMLVVHNGVPDTFEGPPWRDQSSLKEEAGLSPDDYLILNVGSHIPLRNHETLIRAVAIVRESIPNAKCILIGDGRTHDFLQSEIDRLDLNDIVHLWKRRPREEIHRLLPAADLFVNPTLEEGFGIATVEAMLCERPVICAGSGSLLELMEDEKHGLFFKPKDEQDLAQCILRLHDNRKLAKNLGTKAREHASKAFSITRFAQDFERLYYQATNRPYPGE